jgi:cytochrome c-type biogenesis protein CcmH/NrfG
MRRVVLLGLALWVPASVHGDEVYTRSGGRLTGEIVERRAHSLVLDIGIGRVELPLSYVDRVVTGEAPITVYRQRARAMASDDVEGWLSLGHWSAENELPTQAAEAFQRVLSLDPGNAAAQQALGRVNVGGAWMTPEESYEARGLVRFNGAWVSPQERDDSLAERDEAQRRAREEADEQARVRETEARLRAAEAEARIAEARARESEAQARAAEIQAASFLLPVVPAVIVTPPYFADYGSADYGGGPAASPMAVSIGAASHRTRAAADRARARRTAARNTDTDEGAGSNVRPPRRHRAAGSSR